MRPIIALEFSPEFLRRFGYTSADVLDLLTKEHRYVAYEYDATGRLCEADIAGSASKRSSRTTLYFSRQSEVSIRCTPSCRVFFLEA